MNWYRKLLYRIPYTSGVMSEIYRESPFLSIFESFSADNPLIEVYSESVFKSMFETGEFLDVTGITEYEDEFEKKTKNKIQPFSLWSSFPKMVKKFLGVNHG